MNYPSIKITDWCNLLGKSRIIAIGPKFITVVNITPMDIRHRVLTLPRSLVEIRGEIGLCGYLLYRSSHSGGWLELVPFSDPDISTGAIDQLQDEVTRLEAKDET